MYRLSLSIELFGARVACHQALSLYPPHQTAPFFFIGSIFWLYHLLWERVLGQRQARHLEASVLSV
jgi:hypothetical protein